MGAPFKLHYSTNWALKRTIDYTLRTAVTDSNVPSGVSNWTVNITILGYNFSSNPYSNGANIVDTYTWDGTDGTSNKVLGSAMAKIEVQPDSGYIVTYEVPVGNLKATLFGVGGWMPDILHYYDLARGQLLKGDGTARLVAALTISGGNLMVPEVDGSLVYIFDPTGRHLYTKSGILGTTLFTFNYDGSGRLTSIVQPFSRTTTFHRNGSGDLTSIESPWGDSSTVTLTGAKLLDSVTNPNSEVYSFTYKSGTDLLETFTKPNSAVSTFTYDADGILTDDGHSGGSSSNLSSTGNYSSGTISLLSNLNIQTDFYLSRTNSDDYTRTTYLPNGSSRSFTISPSSISNTQGGVTITDLLANDPRFGALASYSSTHTEGTRSITQTQSATLSGGDPLSVTDLSITTTLNSQDTDIFYDGPTKTFTLTTPEGRVGTRTIDNYERTISTQWASDNSINYTYTNDQLTNINVGSRYTTPHYDATSGLMDSLRNAKGETTTYTYDSAKRLTYITFPDSRYIQISYDSAGNVTGVTPPGRSLHAFPLNGHEITEEYQPPSLGFGITVNTAYTYNNDKKLTLITRPDTQTISFSWGTTTGFLDSITTPDGTYNYYPSTYYEKIASASTPSSATNYFNYIYGRLSQDVSSDSGGAIGTYDASYNTLLQMDSDTVSPASGSPLVANYTYDNDELLTAAGALTITRNAGDGRIGSTAVGLVTDTWTHNSYGELDDYVLKFNSTDMFSYTITRDAVGRWIQRAKRFKA